MAVFEKTCLLFLRTGRLGLLPKDLTNMLERFKVTRHQISLRILRMNERLDKNSENALQRREVDIGHHLALQSRSDPKAERREIKPILALIIEKLVPQVVLWRHVFRLIP